MPNFRAQATRTGLLQPPCISPVLPCCWAVPSSFFFPPLTGRILLPMTRRHETPSPLCPGGILPLHVLVLGRVSGAHNLANFDHFRVPCMQ